MGDAVKIPMSGPRSRRFIVTILVVVASALAPLSVLVVWAHRVVLDTDHYVATVGPLVRSSVIDHAVAKRAADTVSALIDEQADLASALPPAGQRLLPRLVEGVHSTVERVTLEIVRSKQFDRLWSDINRTAHLQVVKVLTDRGKVKVLDGDKIVLDLTPLAQQAAQQVRDLGVPGLDGRRLQALHPQLVLFQSAMIGPVQSGVRVLDSIVYVLPALTLGMFGLAVWLSKDRRHTLVRSAIGVTLALGALLAGLRVGRQLYLDYVDTTSISVPAAAAAFDILLDLLHRWLIVGFAVGAVVALAAWTAGPARLAVAIRHAPRRAAGSGAPVAAFVADHRAGLQALLLVAGLAVFVPVSHPSTATSLAIAGVVGAALATVAIVARRGATLDPGSPGGQADGQSAPSHVPGGR